MRHLTLLLLILSSCAAIGRAQEADAPTEFKVPSEFIAPFVDAQTVGVVHIDLAAFRVADAIDVLAEFLHLPDGQRDRAQAQVVPINVFADTLAEGARADVFVVVSLADLANLPLFVVIPREANPASSAIAMEIRRALGGRFDKEVVMEQVGEALVTGSTKTIERLKKGAATARPDIAAAFAAAGDSNVQFLFVPSVDARRVMELLYPKLPAALGGGSTSGLTRSVEWMAVGLSLPEGETQVRITVQATSDQSAATLAGAVAEVIAPLGKRPELADAVPDAEELAQRLMPTAVGNRLSLELSIPNDEMAQLGTLLSPLLRVAAVATAPPADSSDSK